MVPAEVLYGAFVLMTSGVMLPQGSEALVLKRVAEALFGARVSTTPRKRRRRVLVPRTLAEVLC